jgi:hypothetical protein
MSLGAQNMLTGFDVLDNVENESGTQNKKNGLSGPSVPRKISLGAQNMKTGSDILGTVEKESGSAKHENETMRPRYYRK